MYSINTSKWKSIDELPEERYECGLLCDKSEEYIYLFGGSNSSSSQITNIEIPNTILRLNIKNSFSKWEKIFLTQSNFYLRRCNMICFRTKGSNLIYILGGNDSTDDKIKRNDVTAYDCFCRIIKPSSFMTNNNISINVHYNSIFEDNCYYAYNEVGDVISVNTAKLDLKVYKMTAFDKKK